MATIVTDSEQIKEAFREVVEGILHECLPPLIQEALYKPLLTRQEVKELTGWSDRQLQYLRDAGKIDFIRREPKVFLYPTEGILRYLRANYVQARGPVPQWAGAGTMTTSTKGQNLSD